MTSTILRLERKNRLVITVLAQPALEQPVLQVGGGARFTHMVNSYRKGGDKFNGRDPLVLFSGDAFNPSLTSTVYKGKQMVPVLNAIKPAISVYGK